MVHHPLLVGACVCRLIRGVSNKWLEAAGPSPLHPKPVHIWSNEKLLPPRPSTALFNTWLGIQPQAPPPPFPRPPLASPRLHSLHQAYVHRVLATLQEPHDQGALLWLAGVDGRCVRMFC